MRWILSALYTFIYFLLQLKKQKRHKKLFYYIILKNDKGIDEFISDNFLQISQENKLKNEVHTK